MGSVIAKTDKWSARRQGSTMGVHSTERAGVDSKLGYYE